MNFKENLKRIRTERNLTQEQLANLIGVSKFTIRNYEQGQREPSLELLESLVKALECNYTDLMD